jgi:hypothetical protein
MTDDGTLSRDEMDEKLARKLPTQLLILVNSGRR